MLSKLSTIQELRDSVVCGDDDKRKNDETKRIKLPKGKKRRVAEKKQKSKIENVGGNAHRTKRPLTKHGFEEWLSDVGEAVEHFIGMDMDVLPSMPWKRWYREGLSAVVAAKNAVQMYEDLEDDEDEFEDELEDDDETEEDEQDDDDESSLEGLEELFGFGKLPYHKWYKKLAAILATKGVALTKIQEKLGIKNSTLHGWYNAGYAPDKVITLLVQGRKANKTTIEDIEESATAKTNTKLTKSLGGWASALGVRKNSPSFVEKESPVDEEKFAEQDDSGDNGVKKKVETKSDGLFGVNIMELAERANNVVKAKPHEFKRNSDPTKIHENVSEILQHERMLGVDDAVVEEDEKEESQEVVDG